MFSKLNDTTFCVEILHYKVSIMEAERCTNDRLLTFIISEPNWSLPFILLQSLKWKLDLAGSARLHLFPTSHQQCRLLKLALWLFVGTKEWEAPKLLHPEWVAPKFLYPRTCTHWHSGQTIYQRKEQASEQMSYSFLTISGWFAVTFHLGG